MQASSNTGLIAPTSFDASNHIADTGWRYDPLGNLNQDFGAQATYKFDAENRMVAACSAADGPSTCTNVAAGGRTLYGYDGDGRRVTKQTQDGTLTTYLYDASGQLAVEYGGTNTATGTQYLTADQLGSTRVVTDASQTVVARHDYRPFGDEVTVGSGSVRQGITGYGSDASVMMKFTSKERDTETGLDFFGARYFSSAQGRFTSADWSAVPQPVPYADLTDPQTLNLYSYVRNNPLRKADLDGHCVWDLCIGEGAAAYAAGTAAVAGAAYLMTPQGQEATRAFIQGGLTLINKGVDAISSMITGPSTQAQPPAGTPGTPAGADVNTGTPASVSQQGTVNTGPMPLIVVSPGGDAIPVPNGASGPVPNVNNTGKTTGVGYTGGSGGYGMAAGVTGVRIMDPTPARGASPGYPNGYVSYTNSASPKPQTVDPKTGQTVPRSDPAAHQPLSPPKQCANSGGSCP